MTMAVPQRQTPNGSQWRVDTAPSPGGDTGGTVRPDTGWDGGSGGEDDTGGRTDELVARGLADYVLAVADALHVGTEATDSEVTDTVTGYIALGARSAAWPNRDLMLVWNERVGWALAVETPPAEDDVVLAYLGEELVAEPSVVARFVGDVLDGRSAGHDRPPAPAEAGRAELGARLARYSGSER